jgi:hypothetical protein
MAPTQFLFNNYYVPNFFIYRDMGYALILTKRQHGVGDERGCEKIWSSSWETSISLTKSWEEKENKEIKAQ